MTLDRITTRAEHLAWCKKRALEYLPDDPTGAFTSMASDLNKHEETRGHIGIELGLMMLMTNNLGDGAKSSVGDMRNFIEGFN